MSVTAVVVAAGSGQRLGAGLAKAFVPVAGVAMVVHAVRAFALATTVDDIVIVAPHDADVDSVRTLLRRDVVEPIIQAGGATRQESVSRGLAACPRGTSVVAVHDAARPLISPRLVDRVVRALVPPWDGVAPGLPVTDTLKLVDPTRRAVLRTVDRRGVWAVQTPQVFSRATLERVHARVASAADAATDDLSLVERAGGRVRVIEGDRRNLKVTVPADLELAEELLAAMRDHQP